MKTLKNRLKNGVKNCYLLEGDDLYLFDRAILMIKKAANLQMEEFNFAVFDDESFSKQALLDSLEVMPMGSEKRVVLLKNLTKVSESDKKDIAKYLTNPVESTCLVISDSEGKFASLKSSCEFVDCNRFDHNTATAVVVNQLALAGKQISGEACATLLDYCNGYLTKVMQELNKLVCLDLDEPLITKKMVESTVSKEIEYVVFELTEALGQKNSDKVMQLLGVMPIDTTTLALITNHFRRLFFISISTDSDNSQLANLLGVKEYAVQKARGQIKNFSKMQLKKIYSLLQQVDYYIKSGQMLAPNALYYLVFSILYI